VSSVWTYVGGPKNWGYWGPAGIADPLETCPFPHVVTVPDLVALGQTLCA